MRTEYLILLFYFSGVIAAVFAIKIYNKGVNEILLYNKCNPWFMLASWITIVVIVADKTADYWNQTAKKAFNKFFNY